MQADLPYAWLSRFYDSLMDHVSYGEWADFILQTLTHKKYMPHRVLELGAGTCRLAPLLESSLDLQYYVCSDLSPYMLHQCQDRQGLNLVASKGQQLAFCSACFDFLLMTYDSFNYLTASDIHHLFQEVARVLEPGGIFLFDVTTEHNSLEWFEDYQDVLENSDGLLIRRGWYDAETKRQYNRFDWFEPQNDQRYVKHVEEHIQYIYGLDQIRGWAQENGLLVRSLYDGFSREVACESSDRVHFWVEKL